MLLLYVCMILLRVPFFVWKMIRKRISKYWRPYVKVKDEESRMGIEKRPGEREDIYSTNDMAETKLKISIHIYNSFYIKKKKRTNCCGQPALVPPLIPVPFGSVQCGHLTNASRSFQNRHYFFFFFQNRHLLLELYKIEPDHKIGLNL